MEQIFSPPRQRWRLPPQPQPLLQWQPVRLERNKNVWISLGTIAGVYLGIALTIALSEGFSHWAIHLVSLPFIAAFQNHLQILLHEGAHFQLHPKRKWNDLLTDLFCAIPFVGLVKYYRPFHLAHHRNLLNPSKDPEVGFYAEQNYFFERKPVSSLIRMLFLDISGYHYFQFFISYHRYLLSESRAKKIPGLSVRDYLLGLLGWGLILFLAGYSHTYSKLLFYWVLPQVTFLFFFLKLQGYGEHTARTHTIETCTLNHDLSFIVRFFIYPLNSNFHLQHHLYPSVPWYRQKHQKVHQKVVPTFWLWLSASLNGTSNVKNL